MSKSKRRRIFRLLTVLTVTTGIAGAAIAEPPSNSGSPFSSIEATLAIVLDRLDELESKIDSQTTDLRGVRQNWDKKLDSTNGDTTPGREGCDSDRFTCLFDDTAVRDNETGLVWDRSPDDTFGQNGDGTLDWAAAVGFCIVRQIGGRYGFHLPLQEQLASLVDTESQLCIGGGPCLPDGHPFLTVRNDSYWSATTNPDSPVLARRVQFDTGHVGSSTNKVLADFNWWCVRGGETVDGNTHDSLH